MRARKSRMPGHFGRFGESSRVSRAGITGEGRPRLKWVELKQIALKRFAGLFRFFDSRCPACGIPVPVGGGTDAPDYPEGAPAGLSASKRLCPECRAALTPKATGFCSLCALPFAEGSQSLGPCQECLLQRPLWQSIYFLGPYQGLLRRLILDLKFNSALHTAPLLGGLLAARISAVRVFARGDAGGQVGFNETGFSDTGFDLVIPVPLHPRRLGERGYNQSLELARVLARNLSVPVCNKLLLRTKFTPPQEALSRKERKRAVKGVFVASSGVCGKRILLVDDVLTTGATLAECSKTLLEGGAAYIEVAVAARTGLTPEESSFYG